MSLIADLFGPPEALDIHARLAAVFEAWIAARNQAPASAPKGSGALREGSIEMYRDMWLTFATWCADRNRELADLDASDLGAFCDSLGRHGDATPRYVHRMVLLIDWIDRFDAKQAGRTRNPAIPAFKQSPKSRFAESQAEDPLPEFLTAAQARQLIDFVTGGQLSASAVDGWSWQELRNRTATGVQLGGGITPGEVRGLTLDQVLVSGGRVKDEPWALALPGNGNFPARQTPLSGWAGRLLARWLRVRADQAIPGEFVFPATRYGRPWSKASCINAGRDVLQGAGIPDAGGGTFRLRHTFALRQLTRHTPEEVANWLGLQDPAAMQRYQRVLFMPVDIV